MRELEKILSTATKILAKLEEMGKPGDVEIETDPGYYGEPKYFFINESGKRVRITPEQANRMMT